jgi:transposase-like protein
MEAEVPELIAAARGERATEERFAHRNGYRRRAWQTRAGEIELAIPKIRAKLTDNLRDGAMD